MVTWKVAKKCLLFAEGKRGHTLFNGVKCADFPESLLWTESKCGNTGDRIAALMDEGKTTYEIADELGLAQPTVVLQTKRIREKRQFYQEWNAFIEALSDKGVADHPLAEVFTAEKDQTSVEKSGKKGIRTVKDFLITAVTHDKKGAASLLCTTRAHYSDLFVKMTLYLKPFFPAKEVKNLNERSSEETKIGEQLNLFDLM